MKTVYIEKQDIHCTLTTFWYCNAWMCYAAEKLGYVPYINWFANGGSVTYYHDDKKFAENPNQFEWYFKQPFIESPPPTNESKIWTWEKPNWDGDPEVQNYNLMGQPLSEMKKYFKKYLIFNDETNRRGELIKNKYNIDFKKTIGCSWRGTDGALDGRPRTPIEIYFKWIDEILEKEPDLRIACTAEEEQILDPLLARYPKAFKVDEFVSAPLGAKDNPERLDSRSGYEKGLQPALMVWLFSKCAHYIKNRSSTGAVASWLSDGRIICIGHEENLSYNLAFDYVEIKGIKYPL